MDAVKPEENWLCGKCNVPLETKKTVFSYLGRSFTHDVDVCPKCGAVLIPRELAEGRMAEVEEQLEDK
ncbi:MAG: hypothetical protein LBL25_01015 [Oscillospiraceae bacterium]|jgi:ribosomal protein S27AE|nr:hypothetical protein [Oscillospiraceae bacterium]